MSPVLFVIHLTWHPLANSPLLSSAFSSRLVNLIEWSIDWVISFNHRLKIGGLPLPHKDLFGLSRLK